MTTRDQPRRRGSNPFKKARRATQRVKLLLSGGSGSGKSLTAAQLACHMAHALGRPGSVAYIDSEDATALLYSHDDVLDEPFWCRCEQCIKGNPIPLEFDHVDLRDHSPDTFMETMRAAVENDYAVLVVDSASHEWCGVNGCLEQVDALKGDGRGRQTDNAWKIVTEKHNAFLADIRAIPINLIATARTKPGRGDDAGHEIIIQRDKDGPFEYEFQMWGKVSRSQPGTIHIAKSRSGHFEGVTWKKAGKFAAEQLLLWAGQIRQDPPKPAEPTKAEPTKAKPAQAKRRRKAEDCKHPTWSPAEVDGQTGTSCDGCGKFQADEVPPEQHQDEPAEEHQDEGPGEEQKAPELVQLVEAIQAVLGKIEERIRKTYAKELTRCGDDLDKLANLLACVEQVAKIAELIGQAEEIDEATGTKWRGFLAKKKVALDVTKLEQMAEWCKGNMPKQPAATT